MDRDEIRERFSPLLDGELNPEERAEVEAALAQDAELLRELDSLKRVDRLYANLPPVSAPEGFEEGVRAALRPVRLRFPRGRSARQRLWPALAAAAVIFAIGAGVLYQLRPPLGRFDLASVKSERAAQTPTAALERPAAGLSDERVETPAAPSRAPDTLADTLRGSIASEKAESVEAKKEAGAMPVHADSAAGEASTARKPLAVREEELPASPPPGEAPGRTDQDNLDQIAARGSSLAKSQAISRGPGVQMDAREPSFQAGVGAGAPATSPQVAAESPIAGRSFAPAPAQAESAKPELVSGIQADQVAALPPQKAAATQPSPAPATQQPHVAAAPVQLAGRTFMPKGENWYERGYNKEQFTRLTRDSAEWKQLVKDSPKLAELDSLKGSIILRVKNTWYELVPAPQKAP